MEQHQHNEAGHGHAHHATVAAEPKRLAFTIQNLPFSAEAIYAPGHVLTEPEANVLNQTRVENLRNNFAGVIKGKLKALEEAGRSELTEDELTELQSQFSAYEDEYVFQGKRATRVPVDPVQKEATSMAKQAITAALRQKGIDPKNLIEGKMEELVSGYLAKHPEVKEEAQRRVAAVKAIAEGALEGLDVGAEAEQEAA